MVVIDETNPAPFDPDTLTSWSEADEKGLQYYIAAEVEPGAVTVKTFVETVQSRCPQT